MKKYLISYISEFLLSDKRIYKNRLNTESKRKRLNQSHTVDVYIAIDDPASYLLLQILPKLKQRYNLTFKFKTVLQKQGDMYPEPQAGRVHAVLVGDDLPELGTDLVTALASLDVDDLAHASG